MICTAAQNSNGGTEKREEILHLLHSSFKVSCKLHACRTGVSQKASNWKMLFCGFGERYWLVIISKILFLLPYLVNERSRINLFRFAINDSSNLSCVKRNKTGGGKELLYFPKSSSHLN